MTMPPKKPKNQERFEILLEDMQGQFKVVAEGHGMLAEQMELLKAEMKEGFKDQNLQRDLATKALTKRIDDVSTTLTNRIDDTAVSLRQEIQGVRSEVKELKEEVQELRSDILPRLDGHESRLTVLEGKPAA